MTKDIKTITLGCRLNAYESDIIKNYTNTSIKNNIVVAKRVSTKLSPFVPISIIVAVAQ